MKRLIFATLLIITPYCAQSINEVIENLHCDLNIVFKWFKGNQMIANLGKCQFIIYQN